MSLGNLSFLSFCNLMLKESCRYLKRTFDLQRLSDTFRDLSKWTFTDLSKRTFRRPERTFRGLQMTFRDLSKSLAET
jgi:hypothetical protein